MNDNSKEQIRSEVEKTIIQLSAKAIQEKSTQIRTRLQKLIKKTPPPQTILSFQPLTDEPDISKLNYSLASNGYQVYISQMQNFSAKLLNPSSQITENIDLRSLKQIDFIVVPGRAFTLKGERLGRGSGWYDRLFERFPNAPTVGICFAEQIWDQFPTEKHDREVDKVIFA